ncbi:TPR-like protein [Suillus clintonianus]|uniref:TPR-like protein n=1 Tax=Suillus clintonianus TaxID=1904413 RepID=UPI001B886E69|nr:TPR-like protein [Suillus clintonianus]KAG2156133.1 TPR-like protein [Suillus clintonianus]
MADSVEEYRAALQDCPPGHPDRSMTFNNLAISLRNRFLQQGDPADLDEAIELLRAALLLRHPGHPDRSMFLNNLAISLRNRFQQRGVSSESDLDEAIELHRAALLLYPPGHSDRIMSLSNLANTLRDRFQQRSVLSDLVETTELYRAALSLRPPGHPDRFKYLNNLAISLQDLFQQGGVQSDLDEAIELHQTALSLCSLGDPNRSMSLNNLALGFRTRFEQRGIPSDLDETIELQKAALLLRPPGNSHRSMSLDNLANSLRDRFMQRGVPSDLDEAIKLHRAALSLRPPGDLDRSKSLNNLAICLRDRSHHRGVPSDLDEAIELHQAALLLRPTGHPLRSTSLNNLAVSFRDRFQKRCVLSDLDETIELHRAILSLRPPGHYDRSTSLNNLAMSLRDRFHHRGVPSDLDEVIELNLEALFLRPPGHSERSMSLNNLAISLGDRFHKRGIPSDLDEAIEHHRAALCNRHPGHPDRYMSLNNLAINLRDRFQQRGALSESDLDEAIELHRAALLLYPPGHSDRSTSLNNLAMSLQDRFPHSGIPSDLDEAIELHRTALSLHPPGHYHRSTSLDKLAIGLRDRFKQRGVQSDLDEAFKLHLKLSYLTHAASREDLNAAKSWATSAEEMNHGSALVAYKTALQFLDQHVALLPSPSRNFDVVREAISSLASDAFSCGLRRGALTTAVELVEQGRAMFWTQLARFRTPLDELSTSGAAGEALAAEFIQLGALLRNTFDESTEDKSSQIRQPAVQWDDVVFRIRMCPDFSRFLLPPLFSDLQKAAAGGPVIIVNASRYGCDALIILSAQDPVHVPLDIAQAEVSELSSEFQSLAKRFGTSDHRLELLNIVGILRKLWFRIVSPIVEALKKFIQLESDSRIWWCPTAEFTLLPLHAAGPYAIKSQNLSQICISSYTPTLATLVRARQRAPRDAFEQHFVAIGQGNPDRGKELRCVAPELAAVAQRLSPVTSFTSLQDTDATVQGAFDALHHNQWLHLACHGMPNRQQPFESSFAMRDGPLMIKNIIRSDWQNSEFAFLSACHTTVGDEKSPDESIHLAAAMQFSGFRSVIGSMWSVDDGVAHQVVSAFYNNLVDGSGTLDCTRAAMALHEAVKSLRKKIPLEQQIVFVHIGI